MKIIQLPDSLANKIAAGEVVERPASVVKELVENSIDAGSTWIKVDVSEAGTREIKVTDNGVGMNEVDCEKAFLRHATSKIKSETDLFRVKTLGFRGEALASIASVSELTLKTSDGEDAGTYFELSGGYIKERKKSDARQGTEITVRNLFFNTPARLKYMKTIHTELGHITDLLNRLALANPNIRFEVTHNGKVLLRTPGTGDRLQGIAQIYGMGVARKMLEVEAETIDFSIHGYISKPDVSRANKSYISTIINGRYIRSYPLVRAITEGYHTLLPIHRFPIVVLEITMDPLLVDVNVHPTKLEVRFSKDKELFQTISEMIKAKFRTKTLIPEIEKNTLKQEHSVQDEFNFDKEKDKKESNLFENRVYPEQIQENLINSTDDEINQNVDQPLNAKNNGNATSFAEVNDNKEIDTNTIQRVPMMHPIGQLHGTYILAQNDNGFYMIDQHAAQERIKYEVFKTRLGKPVNQTQQLLLPITFEFSNSESLFIKQYKEELANVGLYFEDFGENSFAVRSYPTWFPKGFEEEMIRDMVEAIINEGTINIENIREDVAIMMACKGSIKANHYLNESDIYKLLEDLRQTTDPFTCPHGRPVIIYFSSYELEKMFKRVM